MTKIPREMTEYLYKMITPEHVGGRSVIVWDLNSHDWSQYEDESIHGFIGQGTPTSEQVKEIDRILKPGAHVLLFAPDENPSGYKGTIALEEGGFEIRDAICVLDKPDEFCYTAKASRSEREAGCETLNKGKRDETRKEGNPGGDNPRNRGVNKVRNIHPTVKPISIMEFCLRDIPKDFTVMDPFMGSGTTMIACLRTGHEGIGIELNGDYARIATARINHFNEIEAGWSAVKIDSETSLEAREPETVTLDDLFGF